MGCSQSKPTFKDIAQGRPGSTRAQVQTETNEIIEATRAAIRAEVARVKALPAEERAKIGDKYTDPEKLWLALEAGDGHATLVLSASWLRKQKVADGFRLPKRGDPLPPEAIISVARLREIAKKSKCEHGTLPVISLSHFWRTKEHPDPDGETAGLVIDALNQRWFKFEEKGVTDLGVIIDWCALWQHPRETPEKELAFSAGLKGINQWYAHIGTTVWLITAGADRVNGLEYWDKGWTSFEYCLAMLIKPANTSGAKDWAQVVDLGKEYKVDEIGVYGPQTEFDRPPLTEPLAFFGGHENGDKTYTNGADRDEIVAPKFRETMFEVMGGVRELNFNKLKWGDDGIKALAVVLPLCGQLTTLKLWGNEIGPEGARAIGEWLRDHRTLKELWLGENKIGAEGAKALADALRVNYSLTVLYVENNELDDESQALLRDAVKDKSGFQLVM